MCNFYSKSEDKIELYNKIIRSKWQLLSSNVHQLKSSNFLPNFCLQAYQHDPFLVLLQSTTDYSNKQCSKCNKSDVKAQVYCNDCTHFLCKPCLDSHSTWLKHHTIISADDLASGKVTLFESNPQDQYCTEHEEQQKFYCKTCDKPVCRDCIVMKQHCRDHDYVTLKEVSSEKVRQIKELMNECSEKRKQCQESIQKAEKAKSQLVTSAKEAKLTLDKLKKEYSQQFEVTFTHLKKQITNTQKENSDTLDEITEYLSGKLSKLDSAYQEGQNLTETASHVSLISSFPNVQKILRDANENQVDENTDELSVVPTPAMSTCVVGKLWQLDEKVEVPNTITEEKGPVGIAITSENKMAIAYDDHVSVYSRSGNEEHHLPLTLCSKEDITVMLDGSIVFVGYDDKYLSILLNGNNTKITKRELLHSATDATLTVDRNGCIIVSSHGESKGKTIYFYEADSSSQIQSFAPNSEVRSIAALVPDEIAVIYENNTLETIDYSGKSIHTFPPPPVVNTWDPECICCSKKYEVFVVNQGDPKAIYRYTAGGEYIGCVTTEITDARGIAISHDDMELFVTEFSDSLVKIFKRP